MKFLACCHNDLAVVARLAGVVCLSAVVSPGGEEECGFWGGGVLFVKFTLFVI